MSSYNLSQADIRSMRRSGLNPMVALRGLHSSSRQIRSGIQDRAARTIQRFMRRSRGPRMRSYFRSRNISTRRLYTPTRIRRSYGLRESNY